MAELAKLGLDIDKWALENTNPLQDVVGMGRSRRSQRVLIKSMKMMDKANRGHERCLLPITMIGLDASNTS
jgi:hypothetical protein